MKKPSVHYGADKSVVGLALLIETQPPRTASHKWWVEGHLGPLYLVIAWGEY